MDALPCPKEYDSYKFDREVLFIHNQDKVFTAEMKKPAFTSITYASNLMFALL